VTDGVSSQLEHVHMNEHHSPYSYTDKTLAAVHYGFTSSMILTQQQNSEYKYTLPTFNLLTTISIRHVRTSQCNSISAFNYCKPL